MSLNKLAHKLTEQGYIVIPVTPQKNPAIPSVKEFDSRGMTPQEIDKYFNKGTWGIAMRTGGKSKITCLDFDLKYDLSKDLYKRFSQEISPEIKGKMKIQTTMNQGVHWLFKCEVVQSNTVLAERETTTEEVLETFGKELSESADLKLAMRKGANDRSRVLIETRGGTRHKCGGYFLLDPTPGYKFQKNKPLQTISEIDYEELFSVAYRLSPMRKTNRKFQVVHSGEGNPFAKFNKEGDGVALLKEHGWTVRPGGGENVVRLLRPGFCTSSDSGIYNLDTNKFYCFSTSTIFRPNEGLSNVDLLMELEDLDTITVINRLRSMGY